MADDCCLHSQLRQVWEQGWREQLREIEDLNDRLDHVDGHDGKSSGLDLVTLWQESANVTDRAARITRARHLTQDLMRFWRFATPANDHLDPRTTSEMEREPMSHAVALTERRRQLVRHAKAGLVEYRIFGEVLARDDGVLDSLPSTELASLEDVWRQLGAISNVTGLAAQAPKENELDDDVHVNATRWLAREDILARIDNGTAPWQRWWVLPPVQRVGTFLIRCWAASWRACLIRDSVPASIRKATASSRTTSMPRRGWHCLARRSEPPRPIASVGRSPTFSHCS